MGVSRLMIPGRGGSRPSEVAQQLPPGFTAGVARHNHAVPPDLGSPGAQCPDAVVSVVDCEHRRQRTDRTGHGIDGAHPYPGLGVSRFRRRSSGRSATRRQATMLVTRNGVTSRHPPVTQLAGLRVGRSHKCRASATPRTSLRPAAHAAITHCSRHPEGIYTTAHRRPPGTFSRSSQTPSRGDDANAKEDLQCPVSKDFRLRTSTRPPTKPYRAWRTASAPGYRATPAGTGSGASLADQWMRLLPGHAQR